MEETKDIRTDEHIGACTGKVWLVGAGPGDAGLLTVRGREVLRHAEAVIYDALVGGGILSLIPETAEMIYAGKRGSMHSVGQEEINQLILDKAREGLRVVRLKGGDPFVFGRGGEELEVLESAGIPYEVVPGVTSAVAVPAYAGIPVTHRDYCSSVHFITGHRRKDNTYDIDFAALTECGGTLVFLMGISSLQVIVSGLLSAGMDPEMPAAIVEKGTTAQQRRISSTLGGLCEAAKNAKVAMPAVIVVGEVAGLADRLEWHDALPLSGVRAVITRPAELSSRLADMLREKGAETIELPTIRIVPAEEPQLDLALKKLRGSEYEWVVFTSPSGVRVFFDRLMAKYDLRSLAYSRIACIGKGSAKELLKYGIRPDFVPSGFNGRTLGAELAIRLRKGDRILIPRARAGGQDLIDELSSIRGVSIDDIPTYDTEYVRQSWFDAEAAFADPHTYAVFTSASSVRGFVNAYPEMDFTTVRAVCIGAMTDREAELYGMTTYVSEEATLESLVNRLIEIKNGTDTDGTV